ncbi:MAG: methyltransferase domain-containing protein [Ignavibacteria bacterium]|nr:MAG: methyltransferase domain-containing protein [Ignavibacteria bacterium]
MAKTSAVGILTENPNDELIRMHYKAVAEKHGASPRSSMEDNFVRGKEIECITSFYRFMKEEAQHPLKILEIGCGNGYALEVLSSMDGTDQFWGVDFSDELLSIAGKRQLPNCVFTQGDARSLGAEAEFFDWVYTERCLINILDANEQLEALRQIAKVLKRGAYYLMIEGFADGLRNYNKARSECGLSEVKEALHNKNFEKDEMFARIADLFTVVDGSQLGKYSVPPNFLSSHYFVSRVLCAALTKGDVARDSEVAKFFSFLPPMGNYSTIQAFVLRKK